MQQTSRPLLLMLGLAGLLVLLISTPALAGIEGWWTFSYRTPDGLAVTVPCRIAEQGAQFSGNATYPLHGKIITDNIQGKVDQGGAVVFTVTRKGLALKHKGTLSANGRSITGWYGEPSGAGTFTLERLPQKPVHAVLTGSWTYVFFEPGAQPYSASCDIKSFSGGRITGRIRYQGVSAIATFEGQVNARREITFTMHEAGRSVVHTGNISNNDKTISGRWHSDWSSGSFTITKH